MNYKSHFLIGVLLISIFSGAFIYFDKNYFSNQSPKVLGVTDYRQASSNKSNSMQNILPADARRLIFEEKNNSNFIILDVRTEQERKDDGYIKDSLNIDYYDQNFLEQISNLDKNKKFLIYCRSGSRSTDTAWKMSDMGFSDIYNLTGGIIAWEAQGFELE